MLIEIDLESNVPIYEQLKNHIIIGIAKKELLPNDKLPSVRGLAADIGINMHTVNKAYQQLKNEEYILIHRQKGVVVNPLGAIKADKYYKEKFASTLKPIIAEAMCKDMSQEEIHTIITYLINDLVGDDVK